MRRLGLGAAVEPNSITNDSRSNKVRVRERERERNFSETNKGWGPWGVFLFLRKGMRRHIMCSEFSVNEKPKSKIFLLKILGVQVGLYGLEFKGPGIDLQNQFLKLTDLHLTRLGIWIRPWVLKSNRVGRVGGLGLTRWWTSLSTREEGGRTPAAHTSYERRQDSFRKSE